jgi:hypothetical protein
VAQIVFLEWTESDHLYRLALKWRELTTDKLEEQRVWETLFGVSTDSPFLALFIRVVFGLRCVGIRFDGHINLSTGFQADLVPTT